jgi:hypothetical protein
MMPRSQGNFLCRSDVLIGGCIAGVLAGILMGLAASAYAATAGGGWSLPMQMIAATYYGPLSFVGGAGVTTIGVFTHLAIAGALGVIFAALTAGVRSLGLSFILGIIYGIAVWAFMTYVTLAVINETMRVRVALTATWWFFLHWIYGGLLGIFMPPIRRSFTVPVARSAVEEREPMLETAGRT